MGSMSGNVWVCSISSEELGPVVGLEGRWKRWIQPAAGNAGMIWGMGELEPGQASGWHEHPEPEVFYVTQGEGTAVWRVGAQEHSAPLAAGTAFYKDGGVAHTMLNTGRELLRGLFFKIGDAQPVRRD